MHTFLQRFFLASAWPMQTPVPYSMFHIVTAAAGILAAVWAARRLAAQDSAAPGTVTRKPSPLDSAAPQSAARRPPPHFTNRVFFISGLVLAASELYKQGFLYYVVNNGSYDWWYFPFQLCSVPMYLCLAVPLLRGKSFDRVRRSLCTFIQDFGLLGGIMALAEPSGLMHSYWTLTLHGLGWHFMLIFLGLFCAFSGSSCREPNGFLSALPLFAACCVIATAINVAVHPLGNADMFYISPYYPNEQLVFHQIALEIGIAAGNLIYLTGVALGGFLCHMACRRITARRVAGAAL